MITVHDILSSEIIRQTALLRDLTDVILLYINVRKDDDFKVSATKKHSKAVHLASRVDPLSSDTKLAMFETEIVDAPYYVNIDDDDNIQFNVSLVVMVQLLNHIPGFMDDIYWRSSYCRVRSPFGELVESSTPGNEGIGCDTTRSLMWLHQHYELPKLRWTSDSDHKVDCGWHPEDIRRLTMQYCGHFANEPFCARSFIDCRILMMLDCTDNGGALFVKLDVDPTPIRVYVKKID